MMLKIIFIIFLCFNLCMPVPHIPFAEAKFESLEIIYLNRHFLLINLLKGFLASFKDAS